MTLLDLYRKIKYICECLSSADVPLKYNGKDFNIDFEIESKDARVSHIEVKQDLALTWKDVKIILSKETDVIHECDHNIHQVIDVYSKEEDYYGEILKRFNDQREKK